MLLCSKLVVERQGRKIWILLFHCFAFSGDGVIKSTQSRAIVGIALRLGFPVGLDSLKIITRYTSLGFTIFFFLNILFWIF